MKRSFQWVIPLSLFSIILMGSAGGESVQIGPSKDNTLYEDNEGDVSNGTGDHFFVGRAGSGSGFRIRRAVVHFDLEGQIPAGSAINDASLTLNMSRSRTGAHNHTLHKVLADWGEGGSNASGNEGGGAPAATGDATWIHTFFDTGEWTNAGGDFVITASAATSVAGTGTYTWNSPQMAADVQAWLDDPASSFGWLIKGDEASPSTATSKRFDSKENAFEANRPVLTVEFTAPIVAPPASARTWELYE